MQIPEGPLTSSPVNHTNHLTTLKAVSVHSTYHLTQPWRAKAGGGCDSNGKLSNPGHDSNKVLLNDKLASGDFYAPNFS